MYSCCRKRKGAFKMAREGSREIWSICQKLYGDRLDLEAWRRKLEGGDGEGDGTEEETLIIREEYDHTKGRFRSARKKKLIWNVLWHYGF
jgi:hypothetical protein